MDRERREELKTRLLFPRILRARHDFHPGDNADFTFCIPPQFLAGQVEALKVVDENLSDPK